MADKLRYRFPGEAAVSESGRFVKLEEDRFPEGFILTTFNKEQRWIFRQEQSAAEDLHVSATAPFCIEKEAYLDEAAQLVDLLQSGKLTKLVYSRIRKAPFHLSNADAFFEELCASYPQAFVYLASSEAFGTWIGATPETLIAGTPDNLRTMALAGTRKSNDIPWTDKEREEQQMVADYIDELLHQFDAQVNERSDVYTRKAGPVSHLCTDFAFALGEARVPDFINALHPTSAVAGLPREDSVRTILETEQHDRALYAGIIGRRKKGEYRLFVNLRCCQLTQNALFLYLGGGFTAFSNPQSEWEETENKARTLLNVADTLTNASE